MLLQVNGASERRSGNGFRQRLAKALLRIRMLCFTAAIWRILFLSGGGYSSKARLVYFRLCGGEEKRGNNAYHMCLSASSSCIGDSF